MNLKMTIIPKKLISIVCISPFIGSISNSYKNSCLRAIANINVAIAVKRLPKVSLWYKRFKHLVIILYTYFTNSNSDVHPNSVTYTGRHICNLLFNQSGNQPTSFTIQYIHTISINVYFFTTNRSFISLTLFRQKIISICSQRSSLFM